MHNVYMYIVHSIPCQFSNCTHAYSEYMQDSLIFELMIDFETVSIERYMNHSLVPTIDKTILHRIKSWVFFL